ncbi:MAG TPA: gas vesicle protein GvpJ [Mycobacteriales bacterium]|nr:gas vesicle protein GvpJ [Mycobacteriales bacterium]
MTVLKEQSPVIEPYWRSSTLYDVLELILDKGMVIDAYVRVSLVGIELLTIDARIVVASVDTYLQFAERVNRVDLTETKNSRTLPEFFGDMSEQGSKGKSRGMLQGATSAFSDALQKGRSEGDGERRHRARSRGTGEDR